MVASDARLGGVWSELRADAAVREIVALSEAALPVDEVHSAALTSIARVVPFDAACVGAVDPETMLLTSGVTIGFAPTAEESERFVALEYGGLERHTFSNLIDRGVPVLVDAGQESPARRRDMRFNELVKLMGFAHDVRLTFTSEGTCWAVGDLYRSSAVAAFDRREIQFVERAAGAVATATRLAAGRAAIDADSGVLPDGSAVLVLGADGTVTGMTSAARAWIEDPDCGVESPLWWAIRTAAATARLGVPTAYTRVRFGAAWVVVRASALGGGAQQAVAVTIDEAGPRELMDLYMAAHGLTRREREICHEVMAGRSTREIATNLFISAHTVQDHLKSVFAKTGVGSRRELVASFAR